MNAAELPQAHEGRIIEHVRGKLDGAQAACRQRDLPFVTLTYAQSIDGCIARMEGQSLQLSNPLSQKLTHQIRALHDAILIGINTVLCDDPRLTVRLVSGRDPQPVVVDSRLRIPLEARLIREARVRPIILADDRASVEKERQLVEAGARIIRVPAQHGGRLVDLAEGLRRLKRMGFPSVMVEGGAKIITNVLARRLSDQLLLTISPRFIGGLRSVQSNSRTVCDRLPRLRNLHYQWLAEDLILRADFAWEGTGEQLPVKESASPAAVRAADHAHFPQRSL